MKRFETKKELKAFVGKELPYLLLEEMYKDCRQSARELGGRFGVSYHTVDKLLRDLEKRYSLVYTLNLDEQKLGFAPGKLIMIKFKQKPPPETLKRTLVGSIYVQNAYAGTGDFDLVLYVIGLSPEAFCVWNIMLQDQLNDYGAAIRISDVDLCSLGFFPLRNALITHSKNLSTYEKKVLMLLNDNSRMRLKELTKKSRLSQMQVAYTIKKLKQKGVIRSFSALTQNPDKRMSIIYFTSMRWYRKDHVTYFVSFWRKLLTEDFHEVTSDYCLEADTHGAYAKANFCTFKDGEALLQRGPEFRLKVYGPEGAKVRSAVLTNVLIGKLPFHLDSYAPGRSNVEKYIKTPETYPFGGTWERFMEGIDLKRFVQDRKKRLGQRPMLRLELPH